MVILSIDVVAVRDWFAAKAILRKSVNYTASRLSDDDKVAIMIDDNSSLVIETTPQNIYDDKTFFEGYKLLRQNETGLNGALELPQHSIVFYLT